LDSSRQVRHANKIIQFLFMESILIYIRDLQYRVKFPPPTSIGGKAKEIPRSGQLSVHALLVREKKCRNKRKHQNWTDGGGEGGGEDSAPLLLTWCQVIIILFTSRNRRLPSPPQINLSVSPSVRPSVRSSICLYMPAD